HHDDKINASYTYIYLRFASILMALDQTDDALTLLSRLITIAETSGANHTLIVSLVLQAMGLQAQNNIDAAIIALNRALTLAEPQGYVRTFINEGDAMGLLLRQTAVSVHAPSYVAKLLAALAQETSKIAGGSAASPSTPSLTESFSQRELQVLRLLATSLTSVEIGEKLTIAPSTVRSHIKNIYRKLDVHKRVTAVQHAQALGLI
ncbi:MAG: tetratricopeptide repeat protein, partial [Chloroflexi bacterium]|nr:tetratricopeptide repeat protein [Chloroflexota bacterium]